MFNFLTIFSISLLCATVFSDKKAGPIVEISSGKILGRILKSDKGSDFFAFRGIPYAKPPVDDLRFRHPQPVEKWDGILDRREDGPQCVQYNYVEFQYLGIEDCLSLNVYSPKLDAALPVLFFIYGGVYLSGSGASYVYGPQRFMNKNVVLVTINYRLGPFGFLSTGDEVSPGNYGLLDQLLALQWVSDNIGVFGGDPKKVTVFGESAGASSIMLHMVSPLSKGLFCGAILQSGSAMADWAFESDINNARANTKGLAEMLNCPIDSNEELLACLRKADPLDITIQIPRLGKKTGSMLSFLPVIDATINGKQAFLPDNPRLLIKENKFHAMPTMIGVTKDEGLLFPLWVIDMFGGVTGLSKENMTLLMGLFTPYIMKSKDRAIKVTTLSNEYFKNVNESNFRERFTAISKAVGDAVIKVSSDEAIEYLIKYKVPTYAYSLTYRGTYTVIDKVQPKITEFRDWSMVTHLDDLQYLFRCEYFPSYELSGDDKKMADIMITLWTNFAETKVPTLEGSASDYSGFQWSPVTVNNVAYLKLNLKPKMVAGHLSTRYDGWKGIIDTHDN